MTFSPPLNVPRNHPRKDPNCDLMDMMIAAHAVATGAVLVTNDKAFAQVDELHASVNWATPG